MAAEHRAARRREQLGVPPLVYATALLTYVALGYFLRSAVLNWIVGPLFLLVAVQLTDRLRRRSDRTEHRP